MNDALRMVLLSCTTERSNPTPCDPTKLNSGVQTGFKTDRVGIRHSYCGLTQFCPIHIGKHVFTALTFGQTEKNRLLLNV
jgi:hypothetical protein